MVGDWEAGLDEMLASQPVLTLKNFGIDKAKKVKRNPFQNIKREGPIYSDTGYGNPGNPQLRYKSLASSITPPSRVQSSALSPSRATDSTCEAPTGAPCLTKSNLMAARVNGLPPVPSEKCLKNQPSLRNPGTTLQALLDNAVKPRKTFAIKLGSAEIPPVLSRAPRTPETVQPLVSPATSEYQCDRTKILDICKPETYLPTEQESNFKSSTSQSLATPISVPGPKLSDNSDMRSWSPTAVQRYMWSHASEEDHKSTPGSMFARPFSELRPSSQYDLYLPREINTCTPRATTGFRSPASCASSIPTPELISTATKDIGVQSSNSPFTKMRVLAHNVVRIPLHRSS